MRKYSISPDSDQRLLLYIDLGRGPMSLDENNGLTILRKITSGILSTFQMVHVFEFLNKLHYSECDDVGEPAK
jgi:hypothetical protein